MLNSALATIPSEKSHFLEIEKKLFTLLGKKDTKDIVLKITRAVESNSNHLLYRAPFYQVLAAKFYMLFFK